MTGTVVCGFMLVVGAYAVWVGCRTHGDGPKMLVSDGSVVLGFAIGIFAVLFCTSAFGNCDSPFIDTEHRKLACVADKAYSVARERALARGAVLDDPNP